MYAPELYTRMNATSRREGEEFTEEFEKELGQMSGRCLDIGSGTGDVTIDFILPKLNPKATLMLSDISEPMLNFMKEKYGHIERLEFKKLDIETIDLAENLIAQFDNITSFYCIHWCENLRQVFGNIFKLLRPGGSAIVSFISSYPGLNCYKELAITPKYQSYMTNADRYIPPFQNDKNPRRTLKTLLGDVGFKVHHCSVRHENYIYDSPKTFGKFLLSVNPFLHRIPKNLKDEYEKDLIREIEKYEIIFNTNENNKEKYKILCRYNAMIVYLTKPLSV